MVVPTPQQLAASANERGARRELVIDGRVTRYWEYPAGTSATATIIFVHGYRGNHRGLEAIAGALPTCHVLIPDLPGFGGSEAFQGPHSIESYSKWLKGFVSLTSPNATVLGHSFGTIVVAAAAATGLTNPLVLVNPVARYGYSISKRVMQRFVDTFYLLCERLPERLGSALCSSPLFVRLMSEVLAKTKDSALRKWIHQQHADNFSDFSSVRVAVEGYRASVSASVSDFATRIGQSVLLIASDLDDITPISSTKRLASELTNAELEVLKEVGHLVHYERPEEAARLIEEFCRQH